MSALVTLAAGQPIRIGVFSLFKPEEIVVTAAGVPLEIKAGGLTSRLEGSQSIGLRTAATVSSATGGPAPFVLSIPDKIRRRFQGTVAVVQGPHYLQAVVSMDLEQAVSSAAAAETLPGTPLEAVKAQAVAARSYYVSSRSRHVDFDACDSTHCQFLRELPAPDSVAAQATRETSGLVLTYHGKPLSALYSASCGGSTQALADVGGSAYPYYAVPCEYCQRNRRGLIEGHRHGLCQRGAAGMARSGASFRDILSHYYPGTSFFVASPFRFAS
jgi:peptidoglycan hydrolase-like amidase